MTRRPAGLQWRLHRRMQVSVRAWAPHGLSASQSASLCCCLLVPHFQAEGSAPSALPTPYMKMWGVWGGGRGDAQDESDVWAQVHLHGTGEQHLLQVVLVLCG